MARSRYGKDKRPNQKRKGGKPKGQRYAAAEKEDVRSDDRAGSNDISWYSRYPNLLVAAGSFPYPYRPGMHLPLGQGFKDDGTTSVNRTMYIPGVCTLDWMPSLGISNTATDPASILAKEMYAKVRGAFSGSLDADAPDFVVYVMALDSIFSYLAWLKRVYRVMNSWTPENYAVPDEVMAAMGFTAQDILSLRKNRTELWQIINELVLQSRKFTCPAVMDVFNRHYWMSDNVYMDAGRANAQFYMFNLVALFQYAELPVNDGSGNTGAGLEMVSMPIRRTLSEKSTPITPSTLYQFGRGLIDALVAWDDAYTINGYLMRAYQGTPNFVVAELDATDKLVPLYNEEVLTQIENSRGLPYGSNIAVGYSNYSLSGFNVTQNPLTNAVISNPRYVIPKATVNTDPLGQLKSQSYTIPPTLSIRSETPTVADSVVATRLQAAVKQTSGGGSDDLTVYVDCATEVPCAWRLNYNAKAQDSRLAGTPYGDYVSQTAYITTPLQASTLLAQLNLEQFDWHPFVWVQFDMGTGTVSPFAPVQVLGDTNNITVIHVSDLANLHNVCVYSEFNAFEA